MTLPLSTFLFYSTSSQGEDDLLRGRFNGLALSATLSTESRSAEERCNKASSQTAEHSREHVGDAEKLRDHLKEMGTKRVREQ
jgi:hypothetical protein